MLSCVKRVVLIGLLFGGGVVVGADRRGAQNFAEMFLPLMEHTGLFKDMGLESREDLENLYEAFNRAHQASGKKDDGRAAIEKFCAERAKASREKQHEEPIKKEHCESRTARSDAFGSVSDDDNDDDPSDEPILSEDGQMYVSAESGSSSDGRSSSWKWNRGFLE